MLSRLKITILVAGCALAICQLGQAQVYTPPPTMGSATPGTPGYTPPSHGYKANPALIGGLVGGGAAAAGGLYYFMKHRNIVEGCVGPDGTSLTRDKDGKRFQLQGTKLQAGERVRLKAKKSGDDSSGSTLDVSDIRKDFGPCEQSASAKP